MISKFSSGGSVTWVAYFVLFASLVVVGCGGDTDPEAGFNVGKERDLQSGVTLVKGSHGSDFDEVSFDILTPTDGSLVEGDSIDVVVSVGGVELKAPTPGEGANSLAYSHDGQHIHVIINNEPYMAMYDTTFRVSPIEEGENTMIAFPSRSWHESVKKAGAVIARTFYHNKEGTPTFDKTAPTLVYSRPKGTYTGKDAAKVMLDFYLLNVDLSADGYRVIASIDGAVIDTIDAWVPYYIEGLKDGEHTIGLQLIDADGAVVENGPYGTVERTITIAPAESGKKEKSDDDEGTGVEEDIMDVGTVIEGL